MSNRSDKDRGPPPPAPETPTHGRIRVAVYGWIERYINNRPHYLFVRRPGDEKYGLVGGRHEGDASFAHTLMGEGLEEIAKRILIAAEDPIGQCTVKGNIRPSPNLWTQRISLIFQARIHQDAPKGASGSHEETWMDLETIATVYEDDGFIPEIKEFIAELLHGTVWRDEPSPCRQAR